MNFAQNAGARFAGATAALGLGLVAGGVASVGLMAGASKNPLCYTLLGSALCLLGVGALSVGIGVATTATAGRTLGTFIAAGLSTGRRDSQTAAIGMWILGITPGNTITYNGKSVLAQQLQQQQEVANAREDMAAGIPYSDFFYSATASNDPLATAGNLARDSCTYLFWSSSCGGAGDRIKAGMGSYSGSAIANSDGSVTYTVNNPISLGSAIGLPFIPGLRELIDDHDPKSGPL